MAKFIKPKGKQKKRQSFLRKINELHRSRAIEVSKKKLRHEFTNEEFVHLWQNFKSRMLHSTQSVEEFFRLKYLDIPFNFSLQTLPFLLLL